jgi:restriction system-associated AAA family ATPase
MNVLYNHSLKDLYFLRLLNNHLIGAKTQKQIREGDIKTNISALLPKHEEIKKIFNISDIAFKKEGFKEPIYYKQLSDGEHQLLHVVGMMLLVDRVGVLFLLDEPETHFNPDWRSKFVSILNECVQNENGLREQEVILTTHSPFVVSDCKKEKVFIFNKENGYVTEPKNPDFQTYGTAIEMIYWHIFGKHETIAKLAFDELKEIEEKVRTNKLTKDETIKELSKYGDSFEKMNIVRLLREKYS